MKLGGDRDWECHAAAGHKLGMLLFVVKSNFIEYKFY